MEDKKEVKLHKQLSSKIRGQRWNLHFEIERVLHYFNDEPFDDSEPDACKHTNPVETSWPSPKYNIPTSTTPPPIPSSKYPPSHSLHTFTASPTSTSPPTNPPTKWYQNSLWPSKSYIRRDWRRARREDSNDWEKDIQIKYG